MEKAKNHFMKVKLVLTGSRQENPHWILPSLPVSNPQMFRLSPMYFILQALHSKWWPSFLKDLKLTIVANYSPEFLWGFNTKLSITEFRQHPDVAKAKENCGPYTTETWTQLTMQINES